MAQDDLLDKVAAFFLKAVGFGSPGEQIAYSLFLVLVFSISSAGLVVTAFLAFVMLIFLFLGVLRLIPQFDALWPLSAGEARDPKSI